MMPGGEEEPAELAAAAACSEALRELLLRSALRSGWRPRTVAAAVRWLLARGLCATPAHCRQAAMWQGSLTVLRVFLMEAHVDVRGLELLAAGGAAAKQAVVAVSGGSTSWVQHCKQALKALLARGAVLGSHSSRSKLLRRLAEDGDALWACRALASLRCAYPEAPDAVLERIRHFVGLASGAQGGCIGAEDEDRMGEE